MKVAEGLEPFGHLWALACRPSARTGSCEHDPGEPESPQISTCKANQCSLETRCATRPFKILKHGTLGPCCNALLCSVCKMP